MKLFRSQKPRRDIFLITPLLSVNDIYHSIHMMWSLFSYSCHITVSCMYTAYLWCNSIQKQYRQLGIAYNNILRRFPCFDKYSLQWCHNERNGVSNHRRLAYLLISFWGVNQRKHQRSASLAFVRGIHRWPVESPLKGPVTRKMLPFHVIVCGGNIDFFFIHGYAN